MGRVTKNMKRGDPDQSNEANEHPCSYPENATMPEIKDLDDDLGFTDNSAHAIHRENLKKNKGISKTHD